MPTKPPDPRSVPDVAPVNDAPLPVRRVSLWRPLQWLALGWHDFRRVPGVGIAHGAFVAFGGLVVLWVSARFGLLAPGAFSGFVIVGPILATGLYEASRLLGRGKTPTFGDAAAAWRRGTRPLVGLGILLALLGSGWVVASALLFRAFLPAPPRGPLDFPALCRGRAGEPAVHAWAILGGMGVAVVSR
jgi:uncharacterized membrane protein